MGFFDLNIPYNESPKRNSTGEKSVRLKLAVKAMELGYSGVAYNRTITGVMSEADHCSISIFPLSSVLKVSPSISSAVNLHRRLLNVPTTTPFRQYTRLTVVVDTPAQGSCLNSGNPVLKTYDIVAVRPLKQESFDQACKNYEVDIIAIDFSENRFRLKQPLVKAAIERGVCFEITYSGLVMDAQLRRQMISNAKLLVDWTRGKNIIISSAAASVTEFRGPYDVANLACLLGFSTERARASVSKTCRSLLENSIRKKKFIKEAIRVELISSTEDGFDDWLKWDPISSGEGDLQLDDMAKSFGASNKEPKTVKAIDFVSVMNELPSHGLQINNMLPQTKLDCKFHDLHEKDELLKFENSDAVSANENLETLVSVEAGETCDMIIEEPEQQNLSSKVHEDIHEENVIDKNENESENVCSCVTNPGMLISFDDNPSNLVCEEPNNLSHNASIFPPMTASNEAGLPEEVLEEHMSQKEDVAVIPASSLGVSIHEDILEEHENVTVENVSSTASFGAFATLRSNDELQINGCNSVVHEPSEECAAVCGGVSSNDIIEHNSVTVENILNPSSGELVALRSHDDSHLSSGELAALRSHDDSHLSSLENASMEVNVEVKDDSHLSSLESSSVRVRRKHGSLLRPVSFPFKRFLHFKKARKIKRKGTVL